MIEIIESAKLNSVQDLGRTGHRALGISQSGAMDSVALAIANVLLGNEPSTAAIEVQMFPLRLRFKTDSVVAVTGADSAARIDGRPLPPWWATPVRAGQELALSPPRKGLRSYVAVAGGLDVPIVMGSRSTYFRTGVGGYQGRTLRKGDQINFGTASVASTKHAAGFGVVPPDSSLPPAQHRHAEEGDLVLRVITAAEYPEFPLDARESFWRDSWLITVQSNRMGYRLEGPALVREDALELRSRGIVPGVVQVPPGGQPIIQLMDANSAGGYAQIGCVINPDLWRLAQAAPGTRLRFARCDLGEARQAEIVMRDYIARIRQQAHEMHVTTSDG